MTSVTCVSEACAGRRTSVGSATFCGTWRAACSLGAGHASRSSQQTSPPARPPRRTGARPPAAGQAPAPLGPCAGGNPPPTSSQRAREPGRRPPSPAQEVGGDDARLHPLAPASPVRARARVRLRAGELVALGAEAHRAALGRAGGLGAEGSLGARLGTHGGGVPRPWRMARTSVAARGGLPAPRPHQPIALRLATAAVALAAVAAPAAGPSAQDGPPPPVSRIVAIGDVHGDFGQLVAVLRAAGLIDRRHRWQGGPRAPRPDRRPPRSGARLPQGHVRVASLKAPSRGAIVTS